MGNEQDITGRHTVVVVPASSMVDEEAINFADIIQVLWRKTGQLLLPTVLLGFAFGIHAWLSTPIYRAEVLMAVATDRGADGLAGIGGALGSLASVAGVDLTLSEGRRAEYVAMLSSRSLAHEFIAEQNLMPLLYPSRWDATRAEWRSAWRHAAPPTRGQAVKRFHKDVLKVVDDKKTGLITVSISLPSREESARVASRLIDLVNNRARAMDVDRSKRGIEYLTRELERTSAVGVRDAIFRLIETNLNRIMMANVEEQYAFRIIDDALVPEEGQFVKPQRLLQTIAGAALGALLGLAFVLWRDRADWLPRRRSAADAAS